ncbi:MAG: zf-HC2 domain-containing protein, partial [Burkholderiales bacterium]|nr:zf-HC2 domain-containing protein [Burkholderiales bacterium]
MTGHVLPFDAATHKVVDVLLPWFANGTLETDERALVEQHLGRCPRCRQEIEWLRELHAACAAAAVPGASPAMHRIRERLLQPRPPGWRAGWQRIPSWSRAAIVAQLVLIIGLGGAFLAASDARLAPYRTLADPGSSPATAPLVAVFDPATPEFDIRRMLRAAHARIVDGPT